MSELSGLNAIVRMKHVRKAKMCSSGARAFFERHELDWADFLKNGIPSQTLLNTGDAMAAQVVRIANE